MSTSREEIDRLLNPPKFTPAAGTDRKLSEIEEKNPIMGAHARAFMDYARENGVPDAYIKSGYRTAERQNYLHTHGYPTKGNDGYTKISPHQDARAIDWSSSPATRKKLHSLLTTFASERGLHVPGDEPWHMALPRDRVNVSRDVLDEILGLSPTGDADGQESVYKISTNVPAPSQTPENTAPQPTYGVQPYDSAPSPAVPAPDVPPSIPAVALPTAPTYKPPPRPARATDEFTAAETGDEPIKPFDKEWAGALGQIGNAGPEAQQAYLEFVRQNTKEGKVDPAISDEANAQTFVKIQAFLAQNPDASPEDLTKGIADIGLEFLNDPATKGKVLPKSLHDAMLRAPYAPDEVEKLPKKIQQQRQQLVAAERKRTVETALQKQTATLAKNAPDKLAAHIAWHFGPQTLAAIGSLPASKQRQIATMAVRAAADDEVRKARGEQIVESADYQATMRKRAGLPERAEGMVMGDFRRIEEQENKQPSVGMGDVRRYEDRQARIAREIRPQVIKDFFGTGAGGVRQDIPIEIAEKQIADDPRLREYIAQETNRRAGQFEAREQRVTQVEQGTAPLLGIADKVRELRDNPEQLIPFLSSIPEFDNLLKIGESSNKLERGEDLTEEERLRLREFVAAGKQDKSVLYQIANVLSALPSFVGEFVTTGGIYTAGRKAALKGLEKIVTKKGLATIEKQLVGRLAVKGATSVAGAAAQTLPAGATRIPVGVLYREQEGQEFATALRDTVADQFIEVASERTGGVLSHIPLPKRLSAIRDAVTARWLSKAPGRTAAQLKQIVDKTGWHGPLGEVFEERVGDVARFGAGLQESPMPSLEQLAVEGLSFSVPGATLAIADRLTRTPAEEGERDAVTESIQFQRGQASEPYPESADVAGSVERRSGAPSIRESPKLAEEAQAEALPGGEAVAREEIDRLLAEPEVETPIKEELIAQKVAAIPIGIRRGIKDYLDETGQSIEDATSSVDTRQHRDFTAETSGEIVARLKEKGIKTTERDVEDALYSLRHEALPDEFEPFAAAADEFTKGFEERLSKPVVPGKGETGSLEPTPAERAKIVKEVEAEGAPEIEAQIVKPYKPRSRAVDTQTMSLSQAVRAAGGVKADRDLANQGEVSRLSNKEAATSGLVNNRSGSKVEDMAMAMAEQGYRGDWVRVEQDRSAMQGQYFEINADKFLEAVENDQRGISPSHSMERNMDFDAEYRKEFPDEMASYDNLISLMENDGAGKIYDKVINGEANEADITAFRKVAKEYDVSEQDVSSVIADGEQARSPEAIPRQSPSESPAQQLGFVSEGLEQQSASPPRQSDQRARLIEEEQARQRAKNPEKAAALETLARLREKGMTVDDYARQGSLIGETPSPEKLKLLRELEGARAPSVKGGLVEQAAALVDERGNLTRGGDYINSLMKGRSDAEVIDLLQWARTKSEHVQRFTGGNVIAELRSRGIDAKDIPIAPPASPMGGTLNFGPGAASAKEPFPEVKERKFGKRFTEDENIAQEIRDSIGTAKYYEPIPNNVTAKDAQRLVDERGISSSMAAIRDENNGLAFHVRSTMGQLIVKRLNKAYRALKANSLADAELVLDQATDMAEWQMDYGTRLGQGVQSFAIWARLTPEGKLLTFKRAVDKARQRHKAAHGEEVQEIVDAANKEGMTDRQRLDEVERLFKTNKTARKVKTDLRRLIDAAKDGKLTDEKFYEITAKRLGLPEYDKNVAARITEIAGRIEDAPEGIPQDRAIFELNKYIAQQKGFGVEDLPIGIYYGNILSGYNTHIVNTVDTFMNVLSEVNGLTILNPQSALKIYAGMFRGLADGRLDAMLALTTGRMATDGKWMEIPRLMEIAEFGKKGGVPIQTKGSVGRAVKRVAESKVGYPLNAYKYVTRLLAASDAIMFRSAKEARAALLANRMAEAEGLEGNEASRRVRQILALDREADFTAQAEREGFTGREAKARATELRDMVRDKDLNSDAADFAGEATYNHEPHGTLGYLSKKVGEASERVKPLKLFVPFTRIVANVTNRGLNYTPYGFKRAFAGYSGHPELLSPEARNLMIVRATLGTAGLVALGGLQAAGVLTIHGAGPSDRERRRQLQQAGWRPYSIQIGDKFLSYVYTPLSLGLSVVGNMSDSQRYHELEEKDAATRGAYAIARIGSTVFSQSFLSGLSRLFSALSEHPQQSVTAVKQTLSSTVSAMTAPNLAKDVFKLFDNKAYQSNTLMEDLVRNTPFAALVLKPQLNAFGEPVRVQRQRFVDVMTSDPVWRFVIDKGLRVPVPSRTSEVTEYDNKAETKAERRITPEEYYELILKTGPQLKAWIAEHKDRLSEMSEEKAQDELSEAASGITRKEMKALRKKIKESAP